MKSNHSPISFSAVFDHAAVATREPEKLRKVLLLLGLADQGSEDVASQGVRTHFIEADPSKISAVKPNIEILEVIDPQGVVEKFLAKKGPGIHHLSFRVTDIQAAMSVLRAENIRLVYDAPKSGAHHTLVNFIHPDSTGGILLEISQKASK